MIVSASRRTDIPAFYSDWFLNRIKAGFLIAPNPYNPKMLGRIPLTPDVVDCMVFWTKNPRPMLEKLDALEGFKYYFQYTINPYERDIEGNLPPLEKRLETFIELSEKIGREKVIWRYDPILVNKKYGVQFHKEAFARIIEALGGHAELCMLGFIDHYRHTIAKMRRLEIPKLRMEDIFDMGASFLESAKNADMRLETCTVKVDLSPLGIKSGMCIDRELVERITGYKICAKKDKNQRDICRCIESVDIGTYDTCLHRCAYCYANTSEHETIGRNVRAHDKTSPMLLGNVGANCEIKEREMRSLRDEQGFLF